MKNISERLSLYTQIDNINDEKSLDEFSTSVEDRFGRLPEEVKDLFKTVRLRWLAMQLGFEKLTLKKGKLKCNFLPSEQEDYYKSETFGTIIAFVQQNSKSCQLKEVRDKLILTIDNIPSIDMAIEKLAAIQG